MKIDFDRCDTITADTNIGDLVLWHPETAEILFAIGMHCLGCPAAGAETIREAAEVHGLDADELVEQILQKVHVRV
jgi:hybrid cluster-associated redox disulfide protein